MDIYLLTNGTKNILFVAQGPDDAFKQLEKMGYKSTNWYVDCPRHLFGYTKK